MSRSLVLEEHSNGSFTIRGRGLGYAYERKPKRGPGWSLDDARTRLLTIASMLRVATLYHIRPGGEMTELCPRCASAGCEECQTPAGTSVASDNCGPLCCEFGGHPTGPFCESTIERERALAFEHIDAIDKLATYITADARAYLRREGGEIGHEVNLAVSEIHGALVDLRRLLTPLPAETLESEAA